METPYDWMTVAMFAGLVVLFLQRSMADEPSDTIWHYLPPSVGCAGVNWLGNEGYHLPAFLLLFATVGYIVFVLKPQLPTR